MTADFKLPIGALRRGQVLVTLTLLKDQTFADSQVGSFITSQKRWNSFIEIGNFVSYNLAVSNPEFTRQRVSCPAALCAWMRTPAGLHQGNLHLWTPLSQTPVLLRL